MSYEFRKLYADVVAEDGTVCVLYLTWVRLARRWHGQGGFELYRPDGSRMLVHAVEPPPLVESDAPLATLPLSLRAAEGEFELSLGVLHGSFAPAPPPVPALHWHVKAARVEARARWTGPSAGEVRGAGYVDWVHLTRPTRLLGFESLQWGRAHVAERTVVFNRLDLVDGRRWAVGAEWRDGGALHVYDQVALDISDGGAGNVTLEEVGCARPNGPTMLALARGRVLHAGSAFDAERVPRRLHRFLAEALGGKTMETRWLSPATLPDASRGGGSTGTALHEHVRFGSGR